MRAVGASSVDALRAVGGAGTDSLVVDASTGADALGVTLIDAASADVAGAVPGSVQGRTVESLVVDGKGGNDALALTTPSGADSVLVTPGATTDAGSVSAAGLLPVAYQGLGGGGSVELANTGGAREDLATYRATPGADAVSIGAGGSATLNTQVPVNPSGAAAVTVDLLAGDDAVDAANALPYDRSVLGGDSVQGDKVDLTGSAGPVGVDLAARTVTGYGGLVRMSGVEQLATAQTGVAGTDLTVLGTAGDDAISYAPHDAQSGTVTGGPFGLSFTGAGGVLTVDPLGGTDRVTVEGTAVADAFTVLAGPTMTTQVDSRKTLATPQSATELLAFQGGDGSDVFDVTVYDTVSPLLAVDGDAPSAKRFSDTLYMRDGAAAKAHFSDVKSHTKESGAAIASYKSGPVVTATTRLDYVSVESVKFFR